MEIPLYTRFIITAPGVRLAETLLHTLLHMRAGCSWLKAPTLTNRLTARCAAQSLWSSVVWEYRREYIYDFNDKIQPCSVGNIRSTLIENMRAAEEAPPPPPLLHVL